MNAILLKMERVQFTIAIIAGGEKNEERYALSIMYELVFCFWESTNSVCLCLLSTIEAGG